MASPAACQCHCAEKDNLIRLLMAQVDQLQARKRMLQGANLQLQEQLEDCVQELEAQLEFKEDEVQSLRGTCREMSSLVMTCEDRAVLLQEELAKREELLRANSSFTDPLRWSIDTPPTLDVDSPAAPPAAHSACVQTSPRGWSMSPRECLSPREHLSPRAASCTSDDFIPMSARGTAASMEEVQELRYTVQVLKEQLEEWQSVPNSPAHASSPARRLPPCASLADMLDTAATRPLLSLDLSGSGFLSPLMSPASKLAPTPLRSLCSPHSEADSHLDPGSLEGQVLHTLLISELLAAETIGRQALSLEQDTARQEAVLARDWTIAQHRLLLRGAAQLCCLEAAERQHLVEAEQNFHEVFGNDSAWRLLLAVPAPNPAYHAECGRRGQATDGVWYRAEPRPLAAPGQQFVRPTLDAVESLTPPLLSSSGSSVGDDFSSPLWMEEFSGVWTPLLASTEGCHTPSSVSDASDSAPWQSLLRRHSRARQLLVQQEVADRDRLGWLRDAEHTRCVYSALLCTQFSHGRLAEAIEAEEAATRDALRELFEAELFVRLKNMAEQRSGQKSFEIWENERWVPFVGWCGLFLGRAPFSDAAGHQALDPATADAIIAREGRGWTSEGWEVDLSSSDDAEGWRYALAFRAPFYFRTAGLGTLVRRRKWVRTCELCLPAPQPLHQPAVSP
eukprot:EG_transcript_4182